MYEEGGPKIMTETVGFITGFGQHWSISSADELDQILDLVVEQAAQADDPVAVSLFYPDDMSDLNSTALLFGLGREWSFLEWASPERHLYVPGDEDESEPSHWWYSCDYSEYPPGRGVPIEIVRATARAFIRTKGERPPWLHWMEEKAGNELSEAS